MKRSLSILLAASVVVTLSGCFGSFNLTKNVYDANASASDNKFVQSAVMVGMFIIPIYEVAGIADLFVFNVIEFWSGENPIAMKEGDTRRQVIHADGSNYKIDAVKDKFTVRATDAPDDVFVFRYDRQARSWMYSENGGREIELQLP